MGLGAIIIIGGIFYNIEMKNFLEILGRIMLKVSK
jgi:hypothetical protein